MSLRIASDVVANEARRGLKTVDISTFFASKAEQTSRAQRWRYSFAASTTKIPISFLSFSDRQRNTKMLQEYSNCTTKCYCYTSFNYKTLQKYFKKTGFLCFYCLSKLESIDIHSFKIRVTVK